MILPYLPLQGCRSGAVEMQIHSRKLSAPCTEYDAVWFVEQLSIAVSETNWTLGGCEYQLLSWCRNPERIAVRSCGGGGSSQARTGDRAIMRCLYGLFTHLGAAKRTYVLLYKTAAYYSLPFLSGTLLRYRWASYTSACMDDQALQYG